MKNQINKGLFLFFITLAVLLFVTVSAAAQRVFNEKFHRIFREDGAIQRMDVGRVAITVGDEGYRRTESDSRLGRPPSCEAASDDYDSSL